MSDEELLSNIDLEYLAKLFKIPLMNILSRDLFNKATPKLGSYIVNLDDSTGIGTHWCAFIITDKMAMYFDSFGAPMPQAILRFIKRYNSNLKIIYSIDQIQHRDSIYCGYFCVFWLYFFNVLHKRCTNYRYLINRHNMVYSLDNRKLNDRVLKGLIKNILDKTNR
jgi:hypothetical protein